VQTGGHALATQKRHLHQRHTRAPTLCRLIFNETKSHPSSG